MSRRITKLFNIDIKSVDEANRQVTFCFSDDSEDRQGEIVDQASWDTVNYDSNPIILWGHDPSKAKNVIGKGVSLDLNNGGKSFITAQFDDDDEASLIFNKLKKGFLRCVSAGFISRKETRRDGKPFLQDNELLEVSIVPIPANPRAIALAYKEGSISKKDMNWLKVSMTKELEYLEKQLEQEEEEDDSVSKETEKAMLAAIESMTKNMTELAAEVKAIKSDKGLVADVANADHTWELQDDKWDIFQPVCELYYALQEAWFFSTTPVDAFKDLVAEFADLVGKVADGSYEEKTLPTNEHLAKAFEAIAKKDIKAFVAKALNIETKAVEDEEEKPVETPESPAEDEVADDADAEAKKKAAEAAQDVVEDEEGEKSDDAEDESEAADDEADDAEDDLNLELDDDAELTDELKEQIDSELEKVVAEAVA